MDLSISSVQSFCLMLLVSSIFCSPIDDQDQSILREKRFNKDWRSGMSNILGGSRANPRENKKCKPYYELNCPGYCNKVGYVLDMNLCRTCTCCDSLSKCDNPTECEDKDRIIGLDGCRTCKCLKPIKRLFEKLRSIKPERPKDYLSNKKPTTPKSIENSVTKSSLVSGSVETDLSQIALKSVDDDGHEFDMEKYLISVQEYAKKHAKTHSRGKVNSIDDDDSDRPNSGYNHYSSGSDRTSYTKNKEASGRYISGNKIYGQRTRLGSIDDDGDMGGRYIGGSQYNKGDTYSNGRSSRVRNRGGYTSGGSTGSKGRGGIGSSYTKFGSNSRFGFPSRQRPGPQMKDCPPRKYCPKTCERKTDGNGCDVCDCKYKKKKTKPSYDYKKHNMLGSYYG